MTSLQEFNEKLNGWVQQLNVKINAFIAWIKDLKMEDVKAFFSRLKEIKFEDIKAYFAQLNDNEKYAWIAEGTGIVMVLCGIVLFFF